MHDEHFGEEEVPGWLFPFAEAQITSWSSFAVVWRLKSVTFHRPPSTSPFSCTLPGHPGVSVTIPQSSFPSSESFALTVKVTYVFFEHIIITSISLTLFNQNYNHSQKLERLALLTSLLLLSPSSFSMLYKTELFECLIVMLYSNIEKGGWGIFRRRKTIFIEH